MLQYPVIVPHPADDEEIEIVGELTAWYRAAGQTIRSGQMLYQITWPGIVVDYPSEVNGVLRSQRVKLRANVLPGDLLGVIADGE